MPTAPPNTPASGVAQDTEISAQDVGVAPATDLNVPPVVRIHRYAVELLLLIHISTLSLLHSLDGTLLLAISHSPNVATWWPDAIDGSTFMFATRNPIALLYLPATLPTPW